MMGTRHGTAGGRSSAATLKGCAPDQTLQVIKDFAGRLGRTPSYDEFTREYNGRYISPITTHLGSWTSALRMAGMVTVGEMRTQTRSPGMLVEYLKDFYPRHKRPPIRTECDLKNDTQRAFTRIEA